jgi:hypothetical protein
LKKVTGTGATRPDAETAEGEEVELPHLVITDALTIYALREYSIWEQFGLLGASIPGPQKRATVCSCQVFFGGGWFLSMSF